MIAIGVVCGVIVMLAFSSIWKGYVLTLLWLWFVAPLFGLPFLTLGSAVGLSLVVTFLTYQHGLAKDEEGKLAVQMINGVTSSFLFPAIALGLGWLVHKFM